MAALSLILKSLQLFLLHEEVLKCTETSPPEQQNSADNKPKPKRSIPSCFQKHAGVFAVFLDCWARTVNHSGNFLKTPKPFLE